MTLSGAMPALTVLTNGAGLPTAPVCEMESVPAPGALLPPPGPQPALTIVSGGLPVLPPVSHASTQFKQYRGHVANILFHCLNISNCWQWACLPHFILHPLRSAHMPTHVRTCIHTDPFSLTHTNTRTHTRVASVHGLRLLDFCLCKLLCLASIASVSIWLPLYTAIRLRAGTNNA